MTAPVTIATIKKIANSKGLIFKFDPKDNSYVMLDKKTGEVVMVYATVTVSMIKSERTWREECNKLRSQAFR